MALEKLFGATLLSSEKSEVPTRNIGGPGKVVGIYFSAHWCPPCRAFTPNLSRFVTDWKAGPRRSLLDVVFVSSDHSAQEFGLYHNDMPFYALPYNQRHKKTDLTRKFKVSGIPTLVFIDGETGKLISANGRKIVTDDPKGEQFPWKCKPLQESLGSSFINTSGEEVPMESLEGKIIGLYFSAHWCPPCRSFTPTLVRTYNKLKAKGHAFEIIFCSSDHDQKSFESYFKTMPWLSTRFGDGRTPELASAFNVQGIPKLVLLDEKLKVITEDGRMAVSTDIDGDDFPWRYKPVNLLKECYGRILNESVCCIYFTNGTPEEIQEGFSQLKGIAEKDRAYIEANDEDQSIHYFVATPAEDIYETVVEFLSLPPARPCAVIMDCTDRKWYYQHPCPVESGLEAFVEAYRANLLPVKKIEDQ